MLLSMQNDCENNFKSQLSLLFLLYWTCTSVPHFLIQRMWPFVFFVFWICCFFFCFLCNSVMSLLANFLFYIMIFHSNNCINWNVLLLLFYYWRLIATLCWWTNVCCIGSHVCCLSCFDLLSFHLNKEQNAASFSLSIYSFTLWTR